MKISRCLLLTLVLIGGIILSWPITTHAQSTLTSADLADNTTFNAVARAYGAELDYRRESRLEPKIHLQVITDALAHLDGVTLLQTKMLEVRWNNRSGHADIWWQEEILPTHWGSDSLGRLTFSTKLARGTLDVSGNLVLIDFQTTVGPRQLFIAVIPDPSRNITTPQLCAKICKCENNSGSCGADDCYNGQTCTGSSANCIYGDPPPAPPPPSGSGCGCPVAVIGLLTAVPMSLLRGPLRRRRFT